MHSIWEGILYPSERARLCEHVCHLNSAVISFQSDEAHGERESEKERKTKERKKGKTNVHSSTSSQIQPVSFFIVYSVVYFKKLV